MEAKRLKTKPIIENVAPPLLFLISDTAILVSWKQKENAGEQAFISCISQTKKHKKTLWLAILSPAGRKGMEEIWPSPEHANVTSSKKELSLCFLYSLDILHLGAQLLLYINLEPRRYLNREKKVGRVFEVHGFSR
jgi:hypothetical protein